MKVYIVNCLSDDFCMGIYSSLETAIHAIKKQQEDWAISDIDMFSEIVLVEKELDKDLDTSSDFCQVGGKKLNYLHYKNLF